MKAFHLLLLWVFGVLLLFLAAGVSCDPFDCPIVHGPAPHQVPAWR